MTLENVEIVTLAAIVTPVIIYHGGSHHNLSILPSYSCLQSLVLEECWNALAKCWHVKYFLGVSTSHYQIFTSHHIPHTTTIIIDNIPMIFQLNSTAAKISIFSDTNISIVVCFGSCMTRYQSYHNIGVVVTWIISITSLDYYYCCLTHPSQPIKQLQ